MIILHISKKKNVSKKILLTTYIVNEELILSTLKPFRNTSKTNDTWLCNFYFWFLENIPKQLRIITIKLDPASKNDYFTCIVKIEHVNSSKTCREPHMVTTHNADGCGNLSGSVKDGQDCFGGKIVCFGGKNSPLLWYYYQNRVLEQSAWLSPSRNIPNSWQCLCECVCLCLDPSH